MKWIAAIRRLVLAALLALAVCQAKPVSAVVIAPGADGPNVIAPANDPGWLNVGHVGGGGTGVYLGNRWVLSAAHVGMGTFRLTDGRIILPTIGSQVQLNNPGMPAGGERPDLVLFRLREDPGLSSISIAETSPAEGDRLTMIGAGRNKNSATQGWISQPTPSGTAWAQTSLLTASHIGFHLTNTSTMRWGVNHVAQTTDFRDSESTWTFQTRFDQYGTAFEAQATRGDSGGGVFQQTDDGWQLVGTMLSILLYDNQPQDTVMYGNRTVIADLSVYREQILSLVERPDSLWQNRVNYYDVGGNGTVTSRDVLQLIDELRARGSRDLAGSPAAGDFFFDVNGDRRLSPADLNQLISYLLTDGKPQPLAFPAGAVLVPEPATGVLAAIASIAVIAFWRRARNKRAQLNG